MKFLHIFFSMLVVTGTSMQAMHRHKPGRGSRPHVSTRHAGGQISPQAQEERDLAAAIRASQGLPQTAAAGRAVPDQLPIPRALQILDRVTIRHIGVTQQGPNQCGSRSVANALAVQDIIMAGEPLTSANIRAHATPYDRILINRIIEWNEVADLARLNHLFNAHILGKTPKEQLGATNPYIVYSTDRQAHSLDEFIETLLIEPTITAHVICNTGGHWVLVTIIKQEGQISQILYMDSCNSVLRDDSVATAYIQYLYANCIG